MIKEIERKIEELRNENERLKEEQKRILGTMKEENIGDIVKIIAELEEKISENKTNILKEERFLRAEREVQEKNNRIGKEEIEYVNAIVEKSAGIRFGASIEIKVLYDLTNDKNLSGKEIEDPKDLLKLEGINDYEDATSYEIVELLRVGNNYFFECK